jgi:hypothetical protein
MKRIVVIGGSALEIPFPISFAVLEEAWPAWEAISEAKDQIAFASAALGFLAPVLRKAYPDLGSVEALKNTLLPSEMEALGDAVLGVLRDNKIIPEELPQGEANPSSEATGNVTPSNG